MPGPIRVHAARVASLDQQRFTELCNDLIRAEAASSGIAQEKITTTVEISAPDDGIDARVDASQWEGSAEDSRFPSAVISFQYKGGKCPSATEVAEDELTKDGVTTAIESGEHYWFITSDSISDSKRDEIDEAIARRYRELGAEPAGHVVNADDVAAWLEEHFPVAVHHLGIALDGWMPFAQWERDARLQNEWFPDTVRSEAIEWIRQRIRGERQLCRILGRAGVGKTRCVMEALKTEGLKQRTIYLPDAEQLSPSFIWGLSRTGSEARGVLVIDECTASHYEQLRGLVGGLPRRVTVVAIGPKEDDAVPDADTVELSELSVDELSEIIASYTDELSNAERRDIASRCGGSPKLVVLLADTIAAGNGGIRSWSEAERHRNVREYLTERLFPIAPPRPESRVMRGIALFARLGWEGDRAEEGRIVMARLGIESWEEARLAADRLRRRYGVLSPRGQYLYPTPDILANVLARETIDALGERELEELYDELPDDARDAFCVRLRELGKDPATQGVVERIIGERVFFHSLEDLNSTGRARLIERLAAAHPETVLPPLQRLIGSASRQELLEFDAGRRAIVRALEELAWFDEYFESAARLLLRLAWAENESFTNNATGIWTRLFQVVLGGTSAPYERRLALLKEAATDDRPGIRQLCAAALKSALATQLIHRVGGPPDGTGTLPPRDWRPESVSEWRDIICECLGILARLLEDADDQVRAEAVDTISSRGPNLINEGLTSEWVGVARRLTDAPFELRKPVLSAIGRRLRINGDLSEETRRDLNELEECLEGPEFGDRLRRIASEWDFKSMRYGPESDLDPLGDLVADILEDPDCLAGEINWLFSGEAAGAAALGYRLGEEDESDVLIETILEAWSSDCSDPSFASGYLVGSADRRGRDWLEDFLDRRSEDERFAWLVAATTHRAGPSEQGVDRLERMMVSGLIPGRFVGRLVSGGWAIELEWTHLDRLLEASREDRSENAIRGRTFLLAQYLRENPGISSGAIPSVESVLVEAAGISQDVMAAHHWRELADFLVEDRPLLVAELCVKRAEDDVLPEEFSRALSEAIDHGGWRVFEKVIGPAIEEHPQVLWSLENPFSGGNVLAQFDATRLIEWAEECPDDRLRQVAHSAPVDSMSSSPLAVELLRRHGNREDVTSALAASFGTGSFVGSEVSWLREKIEQLKEWREADDPNIQTWAERLMEGYAQRLEDAEVREEEPDIL